MTLDLSKVTVSRFNFYYILYSTAYLVIAFVLEKHFFFDPEFPFAAGIGIGLIVQVVLLNIKIFFMQSKSKFAGHFQVAFAFASLLANGAVLYYMMNVINKFGSFLGFFIALNLNILNIVLLAKENRSEQ